MVKILSTKASCQKWLIWEEATQGIKGLVVAPLGMNAKREPSMTAGGPHLCGQGLVSSAGSQKNSSSSAESVHTAPQMAGSCAFQCRLVFQGASKLRVPHVTVFPIA